MKKTIFGLVACALISSMAIVSYGSDNPPIVKSEFVVSTAEITLDTVSTVDIVHNDVTIINACTAKTKTVGEKSLDLVLHIDPGLIPTANSIYIISKTNTFDAGTIQYDKDTGRIPYTSNKTITEKLHIDPGQIVKLE